MSQLSKVALPEEECKLWKEIWDTAPEALILYDAQGTVLLSNRKAEKIFGYNQGEILGKSIESLLPYAHSKESVLNGLKTNSVSDSESHREISVALSKSKTEQYVKIKLNKFTVGDHQLTAAFITDGSIRENLEMRFHKMIGEIQDYSIVLLDINGDITDRNKGVERIFGYNEEELISKNYRVFFSEKDQASFLPEMMLEKASVNGRTEQEGWMQNKDGELFWVAMTLTAIHDNRNKVIGYSKITRDLTEKRKVEQMIRTQADELQTKNKELENFTYIASHDLQEPLSTVTSMIELIREESQTDFNEDIELYFSFIEEAAERMRSLIKGLLQYSRLGRDRELSKVNLQDLIDDVKSDLRHSIETKNALIEVTSQLPSINAFTVEIRTLLQNILGNAIKFSAPDRRPLIQLSCEEQDQYWQFSVKDNGIGIKENYLSKIFVIFQRLNDKNLYEGDGIGLAHCKKIVELHDGKIWAESELGQGSTIHFTISKVLHSIPNIPDVSPTVLTS